MLSISQPEVPHVHIHIEIIPWGVTSSSTTTRQVPPLSMTTTQQVPTSSITTKPHVESHSGILELFFELICLNGFLF